MNSRNQIFYISELGLYKGESSATSAPPPEDPVSGMSLPGADFNLLCYVSGKS